MILKWFKKKKHINPPVEKLTITVNLAERVKTRKNKYGFRIKRLNVMEERLKAMYRLRGDGWTILSESHSYFDDFMEFEVIKLIDN